MHRHGAGRGYGTTVAGAGVVLTSRRPTRSQTPVPRVEEESEEGEVHPRVPPILGPLERHRVNPGSRRSRGKGIARMEPRPPAAVERLHALLASAPTTASSSLPWCTVPLLP
jgi:hypothetical protein